MVNRTNGASPPLRPSVMLVEDDEDLRETLSFLIEHRGHSVVTATDGRDALRKLTDLGPPCLILLDLMMPHMDGWSFRRAMLQDPDLASVPVILLSSVADLGDQAAALRATAFLPKPVDADRLYALLDRLCPRGAGDCC